MAETSLGNIYAVWGVPDWEEVFPEAICSKCYLKSKCEPTKRCAALAVIGGMAMGAAIDGSDARAFAFNLKKTVRAVSKD